MNFRVATFNLENLDDISTRADILRPQLERLNADIIAFQEINSVESLNKLLSKTMYKKYPVIHSKQDSGEPFSLRNLAIVSKFKMESTKQYLQDLISPPQYRPITSAPIQKQAEDVSWERPILHTMATIDGQKVHLLNVHLKSKNPTNIKGQKRDAFSWESASGWAEGAFISAMRRLGQAVELRILVDSIFDENRDAKIIALGDFNADLGETEVEAITGRTENTGNEELTSRILIPCELSLPSETRFSLYHQGGKYMLDHVFISRSMLPSYEDTEIHNETLADESVAFATDEKFPASDHAPVIASFRL